ncbi:unnamed protein product [Arctia plantaginis]|uniref:Uncharacterized protein n=1 Tax=Arctia plantaginis TaxID=874455 RepID=A0A8S1ASK0_ARCPL|nr:unnamed protein product [Arctia plantaginis]
MKPEDDWITYDNVRIVGYYENVVSSESDTFPTASDIHNTSLTILEEDVKQSSQEPVMPIQSCSSDVSIGAGSGSAFSMGNIVVLDMSSSSEEGGHPPPRPMDPFRPRGSLRRTPPRELRAAGGSPVRTPPEVLEMAQAAFDSVIAAASASPKGIPAYPPTPTFSPAPVENPASVAPAERPRPGAGKRILSPDQVETEAKRRTARDISVVCGSTDQLAPPIIHTPATEYGSPFSSEDEDFLLGDGDMGRATTRQLLAKANSACRSIAAVAGGQASRLNKADLAAINGQLRVLAEIVGHCCIMVEGQKTTVAELEKHQGMLDEARAREAARASRAEAEADRARAAASAAAVNEEQGTWQTVNYARALKRAPKAHPLNIPPPPAATLAIYPAEGSDLKSAEQTKMVLKKSVEPRELGAQIVGLRRVANSGLILKTATQEAALKIKAAMPATLQG